MTAVAGRAPGKAPGRKRPAAGTKALPAVLAVPLAAVLLWALLFAGTGARAQGQGTVTVLCSPNVVWCDVIKEEFARATGIQLQYLRLSSGEGSTPTRAARARSPLEGRCAILS